MKIIWNYINMELVLIMWYFLYVELYFSKMKDTMKEWSLTFEFQSFSVQGWFKSKGCITTHDVLDNIWINVRCQNATYFTLVVEDFDLCKHSRIDIIKINVCMFLCICIFIKLACQYISKFFFVPFLMIKHIKRCTYFLFLFHRHSMYKTNNVFNTTRASRHI